MNALRLTGVFNCLFTARTGLLIQVVSKELQEPNRGLIELTTCGCVPRSKASAF
jgi:hypothetical protein